MNHPPIRLLPALLLVAVACQSNSRQTQLEQINDMVTHGQFEKAVRHSASLTEEYPDDEDARQLHRLSSVAWRLDVARTLTFDDRDVEALEMLEAARRSAPEARVVQAWLDKTYRKLATRWLDRGLELHADEKLEAAIEAYAKSLEYVPGNVSALNGMAQAVINVNYRKGLSERYYEDGMHALSDYWLDVAACRFKYSDKYAPESERTEMRLVQVNGQLADRRAVIAATLEADRLFGAARNEYKLALALDPENDAAQEGLERTTLEAQASAKLRDASMAILREDYGRATALIEEGLALTNKQQDHFEGALAAIEEARLSEMYNDAISLEKDYRYPEAVAAYERIIDRAQYYRDILTRHSTLQEYMRRAEELYAEAETAEGQERLELLEQIELFWPEFRDVAEQVERLRGRL